MHIRFCQKLSDNCPESMTSSVGFIVWLTQLQKSKGKYEKPVVEQENSSHYSLEVIKNKVWLDFVYLNMVDKQDGSCPHSLEAE